jgi:hypothetical protein
LQQTMHDPNESFSQWMATDDFSPAQFSESNCLNMGRKLLQNIAPAATS